MKTVLSGFDNKFVLHERNLAKRKFFLFSSLQQLDTNNRGISNLDFDTYSKHLQEFHKDMQVRFQNVFQLEISDWIIDPFNNISKHEVFEEELITLPSNFELKLKINILYQTFWRQNQIKSKGSTFACKIRSKIFLLLFPTPAW